MFSISHQLNALAADSPPAEAAQASSTTCTGTPPQVDAVTRNAAAATLRSMGFLDDLMRDIALWLIPTHPDWPPGVQIQLHVDGSPPGASALQYGTPARPGPSGPVHIVRCADGQYAALATSAPHVQRIYCGARPNSLFDAVRLGLSMLDPNAYHNFTRACRRDTPMPGEEAALLRHCLADQLERSCDLGESVLRALDAYGQQQAALQRAQPEQPGHLSVAATAERSGLSPSGLTLSGGSVSRVRSEPVFRVFSAELAAIRNAVPRRDGEADMHYARRLYEQRPGLDLDDLSLLSGARGAHLRRDPAFKALSAELAAIRHAVPRRHGEPGVPYARRPRE